MGTTSPNTTASHDDISTAEAFYRVFRALSKYDRLAVAWYILHDKDIRQQLEQAETQNDVTLKAFAEDKATMPVFETIQALREDLLS
jgi:hypothetical protein